MLPILHGLFPRKAHIAITIPLVPYAFVPDAKGVFHEDRIIYKGNSEYVVCQRQVCRVKKY